MYTKNVQNESICTHGNIPKTCQSNFSYVKSAKVYSYNIAIVYKAPKSQEQCIKNYPFLEGTCWKNIYLLPLKTVLDTYLVTFRFKILHRVLSCNHKLCLWNISNSPLCSSCGKTDNLEHHLYYCCDTTFLDTS